MSQYTIIEEPPKKQWYPLWRYQDLQEWQNFTLKGEPIFCLSREAAETFIDLEKVRRAPAVWLTTQYGFSQQAFLTWLMAYAVDHASGHLPADTTHGFPAPDYPADAIYFYPGDAENPSVSPRQMEAWREDEAVFAIVQLADNVTGDDVFSWFKVPVVAIHAHIAHLTTGKTPFSLLVSKVGWDMKMAQTVKRLVQVAQEIAPYGSFNDWFAARGDQSKYLAEYLRYTKMVSDSQSLDGYVGIHRAQFLACDLKEGQ